MTGKDVIILAPHVDDELIGCYRVLTEGRVSDVFYFFDLTDERKDEARAVAEYFGFTAHFPHEFERDIDPVKIIYAPNISDYHPHHKKINYLAKGLTNKKRYYSIDMNRDIELVSHERKRELLHRFYPSQASLLNSNDKYFLFESDIPTDVLYIDKSTGIETSVSRSIEAVVDSIIYKNPGRYLRLEIDDILVEFNPH